MWMMYDTLTEFVPYFLWENVTSGYIYMGLVSWFLSNKYSENNMEYYQFSDVLGSENFQMKLRNWLKTSRDLAIV